MLINNFVCAFIYLFSWILVLSLQSKRILASNKFCQFTQSCLFLNFLPKLTWYKMKFLWMETNNSNHCQRFKFKRYFNHFCQIFLLDENRQYLKHFWHIFFCSGTHIQKYVQFFLICKKVNCLKNDRLR